jgi:MFS family permease
LVPTRWIVGLGICAVALYVVLGAMNLYFGDLNQDEGWYLYSARRVHEGALPYRDFAFTQGPMLPLAYSLADPLVDRWGVAGGRLFSAALGFVAALAAAWLAARAAPRGSGAVAALLAFILIAGNVYQSYFTTVVKTYSLCALFLAAGLLAASFARGRGGGSAAVLSGVLLALAAGTRHSAGAALPVVFLWLLLKRREVGGARWLAFAVGGALGLAAVAVPFLLVAREQFWFAMVEYHSGRSAGGLLPALVYKAGFISRFVQAFFVPACIGAALVLWRRWKAGSLGVTLPSPAAPAGFGPALWWTGLAVTLVHLAAPFPYEDYQVFVFPVLAAALAASAVRCMMRGEASAARAAPNGARQGALTGWALATVFIASVAASFSSPVNQAWFVRGRDRIWWKLKEKPALVQLQQVAAWIAEQAGFDTLLLTQDTYLAVEAGMSVPPGLEMGPFSYFPDMPRDRAERLRVLNRELLAELLAGSPARIAAFSGYGLAIRSPEVAELTEEEQEALWGVVESRYEEIAKIHHFGQGFTTLRVLARPPEPAP